MLENALRDFRRAGVDRDDETRERLRALSERLTELEQAFSRGIRDGRRSTPGAGLRARGPARRLVADHPAVGDGRSRSPPSTPTRNPFLTFSAATPSARRAVAHRVPQRRLARTTSRSSPSCSSCASEKATLLGYADWPSYDAEVKMIGTGAAIGEFIDRDRRRRRGRPAERDIEALLRAGARRRASDVIDFANWRHYAEAVKRERFGVDAQEVRRYFDFGKVRQGLLDVTGRLFGLAYERVDAPDLARRRRVVRRAPGRTAAARPDPPRPAPARRGKFNHAAQFTLVPGVLGRQLPEGVLVCNFPRGLMEHDQTSSRCSTSSAT